MLPVRAASDAAHFSSRYAGRPTSLDRISASVFRSPPSWNAFALTCASTTVDEFFTHVQFPVPAFVVRFMSSEWIPTL